MMFGIHTWKRLLMKIKKGVNPMKVFKSEKAKTQILHSYDKLLDMWKVDFEEKDIQGTYGTTHVILCGNENNPPLILFHGVGDNSALMWLYNAKDLSQYFRIYAVDTIGGPGKSCPNENYNKKYDDVNWIDELLAALELNEVYAAGVSNGTYLAQLYTVHRPEKVIKLVCMAGAVPIGSSGPMKIMMKIFLPEALFPTKKNAVKLLHKLSGINSHVFTGNTLILEHYYLLLKGFNNMAMRHHKINHADNKQIEILRGKALYLLGEDDPFAKMGGKDILIDYKMNLRLYPKVGHGINHEISEEINRAIIEYFLNR